MQKSTTNKQRRAAKKLFRKQPSQWAPISVVFIKSLPERHPGH